MKPIVQISLDLTNIDEALETAALAMRAGVDWLEAGTPLILAEGLHGVRALRKAFPNTPIVADLKTMDGGYLEAEMMAKAGATHVVVMARAHAETVKCVVKAGKDFGCKVMGDNMICEDMVAGAKWLEDLGCDYIIHHIGYDERRGIAAAGHRMPSPLIISGPGLPKNERTDSLVTLYDLFPTLCDLSGLEIPRTVTGKSLAPLLRHQSNSFTTSSQACSPTLSA